MIYGSVCSGIEAATQAWHPLGWSPAFFSEIDPFPSAVLAHHYGSNLPDETLTQNGVPNLGDMTKFREWPDYAIDILVGGTPCQDYSIAGLRAGMAGSRGQLTLTYVEIAGRYRPNWLVWENVAGVFSSNGGRDFARFLGDLSGQSIEVPSGGWKNSGIVHSAGNAYGLAWVVRDAQYNRTRLFPFAVPQRRRRVFVVGYLGDWRCAAAVLFDRESLSGHPPPRREAGQRVAGTLSARTEGGGGLGTDFELDGGLVANFGEVSHCLTASAQQSLDAETETLIAFNSREDPEVTGDRAGPLGASLPQAQAIAIQERAVSENPDAGPDGAGVRDDGAAYTLEARTGQQAVAFDMRGREGGAMPEGPHDTANIRAAEGGSSRSYIAHPWVVRRLMPVECERLMGFPDGFTDVPWRGKPNSPDGRRYKALGNSMAVNVMGWLGERIDLIEKEIENGSA